jgi:hypothetical protein
MLNVAFHQSYWLEILQWNLIRNTLHRIVKHTIVHHSRFLISPTVSNLLWKRKWSFMGDLVSLCTLYPKDFLSIFFQLFQKLHTVLVVLNEQK